MIVQNTQKEFELPDSGEFVGVVADVVDLGVKVHPVYGSKSRLRVVWVIDNIDSARRPLKDSDGKPFRVMMSANVTIADKPKESTLYTIIKKVLGTAPNPAGFDTEVLIGRSNKLFIEREQDPKTGKWYANVKAILPLGDASALAIPQNFVRDEDKKKNNTPGPLQGAAPTNVATPAPSGNNVAAEAPVADAAF